MCNDPNDSRSVSELVSCALSPDPEESSEAKWALQMRATTDVLVQLAQLAGSKRPAERRVAAETLGLFGRHGQERPGEFPLQVATVRVLLSLLGDEDPDVVKAAVRALGLREDPDSIPDLLKLARHSDPAVRATVERALGGRADPRSDSELARCAIGTNRVESDKAIQALHARPTAQVLALLQQLAGSTRPDERSLSATVLAQLGWRERDRDGRLPFHTEAVQVLRSLLHDENDDVVAEAAYALSPFRRDPASIPDLLALVDHTDPEVRTAVAISLGGYEEAGALEGLFTLMRDPDSGVRGMATGSLGLLTDADSEQIREVLAERLKDEDRGVVLEAIEGLARRGDPRAVEGLAIWTGGKPIEKLPGFILDVHQEKKLLEAYAQLLDGSGRGP